MNRSRINLILGILLFPVTNPKLQETDYLFEYCQAYEALISVEGSGAKILEEKLQKSKNYKKAEDALLHYLTDSCRSRISSYDEVLMLCELYYPLLEMERSIKRQQKMKDRKGIQSGERENAATFYLERMRRIASSLLTYRDGILAIRTWNNRTDTGATDIFHANHVFDKVEIWNILSSYVSPDFFMTLFIVECELGEEALYAQKAYISLPDKLLSKVLKKGMAENHLHFNAGFDYETVWLNKMNLWNYFSTDEKRDEKERLDMEAALFRLLAVIFFSEDCTDVFIPWTQKYCKGVFLPIIRALYEGKIFDCGFEEMSQAIWRILDEETVRRRTDYLLETELSSSIELKTSSEFILLYRCCRYIKERPWDTGFTYIFLQYIRIKNRFIEHSQQSCLLPGLKHFQKFFNQMKQEELKVAGREKMTLDVFRAQAQILGLKKLEIRIAPDIELERLHGISDQMAVEEIKIRLYQQLYSVFFLYRQFILETVMGVRGAEEYRRQEQEQNHRGIGYRNKMEDMMKRYKEELKEAEVPSIGIVFHFIKRESADNISGHYCWRDMDQHDGGEGSNHRFFLRERMSLLGIAIEKVRQEIPKLNEYVVGIDAASDENAMEPWMFAPAYIRMRSKFISRPIGILETKWKKDYYNIQNIGCTYHVGEDYRHIVSGLRHIDEVIEHFYYKSGDRLGHALALGVDISQWIHKTEAVVMPVLEHMENLLWIWGKNIKGEVDTSTQLDILEEKILLCAEKIYKNLSGITVRLLYQAYEKKFSAEHKELLLQLKKDEKAAMEERTGKSYEQKKEPHTYCRKINAKCIEYGGLWTLERLISTLYCPVFEERGKQVELVPVGENELVLYQELQEHLQQKVARKGIYIETNPTSNLNIGDMKDLLEHPIFRMSPLKQTSDKGKSIMVTINSDDPAVFNTNVENEFAYVYYALERAGCAKEQILHWIDKVRQNGMDASFIIKTKDCETLLDEISNILDSLAKFC